MSLITQSRPTLRSFLLISVAISTARSKCDKQRWRNRLVVSNEGSQSCEWTATFPSFEDGYLNLTVLSGSHFNSCSLEFPDGVATTISPGSCIILSSPISCRQPQNDGCQNVSIRSEETLIKIISQNEGDRVSIIFETNQCEVTSSTVDSNVTTAFDNSPTIGDRSYIPMTPTYTNTQSMASKTNANIEIKGSSMNIAAILGASLGCIALSALFIVFRKTVCRLDPKTTGTRHHDDSTCTKERDSRNHQPFNSQLNMVALNSLTTSERQRQTNDNLHLEECGESHYEIPKNSYSPTMTTGSKKQNSNTIIPEQETATEHIYESIAQATTNNGRNRISNTNPYLVIGLSQPNGLYEIATCAQDECNRNFDDVYEPMTPLRSVASHECNEVSKTNSVSCPSTSFRFDVGLPANADCTTVSSGHSSNMKKKSKESRARVPTYVDIGNGPTRQRTEANTADHGDGEIKPNYVNVAKRMG